MFVLAVGPNEYWQNGLRAWVNRVRYATKYFTRDVAEREARALQSQFRRRLVQIRVVDPKENK